ncbi:glycoside hydrolase family 65 protein [Paenibacillus sp. TRM 82003]|uniref:glycoside hydrolase family 65 protein n=1 Tax=Kineococcus sp. TRM81007 TaxID=2925831 RepID=UPI001F59BA00|nr:glycoside hydrolase family 65 protein [Kineococcus sp. TRM81007]MCI2240277.1 glycoside hydrolase family 65 protein [Kineococcus sp. TRM81007]MCI3927545.1 glycoside hydrolase family 65 protein [Paenibacillus sp. TRM 82003]
MIGPDTFPVEPWHVRETGLDLDLLGQTESVFALSNGHVGMRGNLDEGEPHGTPGTYLNSFYEDRPLPYAEAGYGYPEVGQTVVNVTNGKLVRLFVNDEPFDVRYGELLSHERVLDLRAGTLTRTADWVSPAGRRVRVRSTRLVSFAQRAVAAIEYVVEAVDRPVRLTLQSELVANEAVPAKKRDPRVAAVLNSPLVAVERDNGPRSATLVHRTRASGLQMAAGMHNTLEATGRVECQTATADDWARTTFVVAAEPGQPVRLVKHLAYGWSSQRSHPALRDQVAGALSGARYTGWEGLLREQRQYLDEFWDAADVQVEGDAEVQQAVRFALFHVLQAGARSEGRGIPGKGLTGPGYDGHIFWDTEAYVLPVLTYTAPDAARDALRWRWSTMDKACARAQELGLRGAAFPWRTIRGEECSGYWPAGTAAFHVNADIAAAVERYRVVTGDDCLEADGGLEVLVQTARLWMSLGHHDADGAWHIAGVTGPDEYTAVVDDNLFTNLAAAHNLSAAAAAVRRRQDRARDLGVDLEEAARWVDAAEAVHVPYDERLRVHQQHEGFTRLPEWDFEHRRDYPLLLHVPYFDLYRHQVCKQADLGMALFWFGDRFGEEDFARDVDYYERRTVRDSSLSACVQAVLAARTGHLELAHDYTYEAASVDLRDLHHNTADGLHIASLAGTWMALVQGFGGLRDTGGELTLDPALPHGISQLRFSVRWHGRTLRVTVRDHEATYEVHDGPDASVRLRHAGQEVVVSTGSPVTLPVRERKPLLPRPPQPPGREPAQRVRAVTH